MSPRRARRRDDSPAPLRPDFAAAVEAHGDQEWLVRPVAGAAAVKTYRCPGCDQPIPPGTPHLVAWPPEDPDHRRHWHRPCWNARDRRGVKVHRAKNAPRYG